jgi:large subunit ribosomal protein L24
VVEGVNMRMRHLKKSPRHPQGGRLERESPIATSNVMLVTADGAPVRSRRRSAPTTARSPPSTGGK